MTDDDTVTVTHRDYSWTWSPTTDRFTLTDSRGREILSAGLQPAVLLAGGRPARGSVTRVDFDGDRLTVDYGKVNGDGHLRLGLRFDDWGVWFETPTYASPVASEVVSTLMFATWTDGEARPGIRSDYLVHPGSSESSALGPVIPSQLGLDLTTWLGRGSNDCDDIVSAQWGLPVHYVAGFSIEGSMCEAGALTRRLSDSFCLGLTEIPTGDLLLRQRNGLASPWLRTHSDLWHHQTAGPEPIPVGAPWLLAVGDTYDAAVRSYYRALRDRGIVTPRPRSARQLDTLSRSQFNTWGAQCAAGTAVQHFSQAALESIYDDVRSSGLRPGLFVVDDQWEGEYGLLEHDAERFPGFEDFLDRVRADGLQVGLWAAFLRCTDPASHGLEPRHMLGDANGNPVRRGNQGHSYYLFDVSQEVVRDRLAERARAFMRRYRPNLVKFDFGYELPAMANAAPLERSWGGEMLLVKALELVIGAMREIDPDVVVMYYNLSPLLTDFVDLHSTDDMYLNADEYQAEANRRLFFSSILGEVGVPSYGSGGYDWLQMQEIWLDTVAFGPIGSLGSFHGDPRDSSPTELDIARFNGLARLTRSSTTFSVMPLAPAYLGGSSGARSSSWARWEGDQLTAVVSRPTRYDGSGVGAGQDIVRSRVPVAVVSRSALGVENTPSLGLVSLGSAVVELLRPDADDLIATGHASDGGTEAIPVTRTARGFELDVPERTAADSPIEWVEVTVESGH